MEVIKTGVIGVGMMGLSQIRNCFSQLTQYEIVAVCDVYEPNIKRAQDYFDSAGKWVEVYRDYKMMLSQVDFELAVIVTPDYLHEEITVECLRAGKHIRLEKPMAITPCGCRHMMEVWKEHQQVFQIGYELRYSNVVSKMQEDIQKIGNPKMIWCHEFRHPFLKKEGNIPEWIIKKACSGGTLLEKNCHHFDLFNMFADSKPLSIYASGDNQVVYKDTDVLDNAFVTVEYENGIRAMLSLCMFAPELKGQRHMNALEVGILGDKGRMDMKDDQLYIWDRESKSEQRYTYLRHNFEAHSEDILPSLVELAECIYEGKQPRADIYTGMKSTLLALAAEKSVEERRIVMMKEMEV